jgi:glycerol-3-phosphate dehydrogenase (NAD+)
VDVSADKIRIFADVIEEKLGIHCSALSGANVANEVAEDKFCETTVGYRVKEDGEMWQRLFQTRDFKVQLVDDVDGVSLCGALKNIVAVAAGFVDGLELGNNSKAAIIRLGLLDMKNFAQEFFPGAKDQTFLEESAGIADVITSCFGGRNRKVAEAFVREKGKSFEDLENELLGGQKLQGTLTAVEIHQFLKGKGRQEAYPLFRVVYAIVKEGYPVEKLTHGL